MGAAFFMRRKVPSQRALGWDLLPAAWIVLVFSPRQRLVDEQEGFQRRGRDPGIMLPELRHFLFQERSTECDLVIFEFSFLARDGEGSRTIVSRLVPC